MLSVVEEVSVTCKSHVVFSSSVDLATKASVEDDKVYDAGLRGECRCTS